MGVCGYGDRIRTGTAAGVRAAGVTGVESVPVYRVEVPPRSGQGEPGYIQMSRKRKIYDLGIWVAPVLVLIGLLLPLSAECALSPLTEEQVVAKYRARAERVLKPRFRFAGVDWPPQQITLLALKETRRLELWAEYKGEWRFVREYRIKGMSGGPGPKLREGDRQVPEGIYRVIKLNPNSGFHLSMKLNFPNEFDLEQAEREGRTDPGSNIFIHGRNVSSGCLAIGDMAIEELFVLTSLIGKENVSVVISPRDFRVHPVPPEQPDDLRWQRTLYQGIADRMKRFPLERK